MTEMLFPGDPEARRLRVRSWRRGTREMDLILGPFADARLGDMDASAREGYAALLDENDRDLYDWCSGAAQPPARHSSLVASIRDWHGLT